MIPQWVMGTALLMGLALGLGKLIGQCRQEVMAHLVGFKQVSQSLVQRPWPSSQVVFWQRGKLRRYRVGKTTVGLRFSSDYRSSRRQGR